MAQDQDNRSKNQPSHDAQVKGGQHSHDKTSTSGQQQQESGKAGQQSGQHSQDKTSNGGQQQQESGKSGQQAGKTTPSHEESVKGGQHSHSGKNS